MRNLTCLILLLLIMTGCGGESIYRYKATEKCNNLKFSVGILFPEETIQLYYNDEMILKYQVDSLDGYRFNREFCIDYIDNGLLKVVSSYDGKNYIDTTFNVKKQDFGYLIMVSIPLPRDWKNYFYYENNLPVQKKGWGYLPIDKSVRVTYLVPDTIYRNPCYPEFVTQDS